MLVLLPPLHSSKKARGYIVSFLPVLRPLFLRRLRRLEALPVSAFGGSSSVRSHFAITSHWPLTCVRDACSVLASCSLCGFVRVRCNSKKANCAKLPNGTNRLICACPARPVVRAQISPLFLGDIIKRRGLLPRIYKEKGRPRLLPRSPCLSSCRLTVSCRSRCSLWERASRRMTS